MNYNLLKNVPNKRRLIATNKIITEVSLNERKICEETWKTYFFRATMNKNFDDFYYACLLINSSRGEIRWVHTIYRRVDSVRAYMKMITSKKVRRDTKEMWTECSNEYDCEILLCT